jgi:hypothetical protein
MGLDMYAQRLTISSDQSLPELEKAGSFENTGVPDDDNTWEIIFQWRKHPNLHQFFTNIYDLYADEVAQRRREIHEEIDAKVAACDTEEAKQAMYEELLKKHFKGEWENAFNSGQYVLITSELLDELEMRIHYDDLPYGAGFFWGTSSRDDRERERDLSFVKMARELIDQGETLIYTSWW